MLPSVMCIARPMRQIGIQLFKRQLPLFHCGISKRWFSEKADDQVEVSEETSASEIVEPLAHNKFKHVCLRCVLLTLQNGAIVFEHAKENEPATVGEDDWFAIVQLAGTQYKLGKVEVVYSVDFRTIYSLQIS